LRSTGQHWSSFLRNQAKAILACDFLLAVTATFKLFYVFVVIEHGARRLLHFNLTQHPTALWTLQQLREAVGFRDGYRYLLRDRDSIYSRELDRAIEHLGLKTVRSPPRSPKANAICERVIGTIRRECLDWVIPVSEAHLRLILREWVTHYNRARPHSALGPGIPDPPATMGQLQHGCATRQRLPEMRVRAVLGGLHHEYSWATKCL
jgi:putative transposase